MSTLTLNALAAARSGFPKGGKDECLVGDENEREEDREGTTENKLD